MRDVVVVGGGLAGLALGGLLSASGFGVRIAEARDKAAQQANPSRRSINLALSARGIRTLEAIGISRNVLDKSVAMFGRCIHLVDGTEAFQSYDLVGNEAIYSIRRSYLWESLYDVAMSSGADVHFNTRCVGLNREARTVTVDDHTGRPWRLPYNVLIGSDGSRSAIRRVLVESGIALEETRALRHGYLELSIPRENASYLDGHALHIWPRTNYMLIALPNVDGSFSATLFFYSWSDGGEDRRTAGKLLNSIFHQNFPDATPLIDDLPTALEVNPIGRLLSSTCRPWTDGESVLLIGDAAHTMAPFYGQGMNCALEDCLVLKRALECSGGNWPLALADYERTRRPDSEAITRLSELNYDEMSHHVAGREHRLRREVERALQTRFPATFLPLYAMVAFSTMPYAEAFARGVAQAAIVDRLMCKLGQIEGLNFEDERLLSCVAGTCRF